jgi:hypothetical protein
METFNKLLTNDDLRPFLEKKETIVFVNLASKLAHIEAQVAELGFADRYWSAQLKNEPSVLLQPREPYSVDTTRYEDKIKSR